MKFNILLILEMVTHLAQEHIVRLVLGRHEHDKYAIEELQTLERGHAHIKKDAEQNWHGNVTEQRGQQHGAADGQEDQNVGHPLLAHSQELWLLARGRALRFQFQRVHVVDAQHGGSHEPEDGHILIFYVCLKPAFYLVFVKLFCIIMITRKNHSQK